MTMRDSLASRLLKERVFPNLKKNLNLEGAVGETNPIDAETQQRVINEEIRIATDPDYALQQSAKRAATRRLDNLYQEPKHRGEDTVQETNQPSKEDIIATVGRLIESGVDPKVVGQILMGSTPVTVAAGQTPIDGILKTLLDFMDKIWEKKSAAEQVTVEARLKSIESKIGAAPQAPANATPPDPFETTKKTLDLARDQYNLWRDMGLIPDQAAPAPGETIDNLKEKNRHDEEMARLNVDKAHKEKLGEIAASIPENIGKGIAKAWEGEEGSPGSGPQVEYFECEDCHTKIHVTPDMVKAVCGKCGREYGRQPA